MKNEGTEAKLAALQSLGYIFRIPGGKSRVGYHSTYCLIPRYIDSVLQIVVIPYSTSKVITQPQEEELFEEEIRGTLELKIVEQTGITITEYSNIGMQKANNNNPTLDTEQHMKYLFHTDIYDDSNIRQVAPLNKKTDIPLWVAYERAKQYVCPQHQWMLSSYEEKVLMPRLKNSESL